MFVTYMSILCLALSPAAAAPLTQATSLAQQSPASWRTDGSLIGGGAKSLAILVSDPANAQVTNNQAVTITDKGTAGSDNHLTTCGPPSAYPAYGTGGVWMNFPDMFNKNKQSMTNNGATDEEIGRIYNSINTIAAASLVDRRVILAVIMQESHGNPRVGSTTSHDGVGNPGLMQSHQGVTCANQAAPCPQSIIDQMVRDGTQGTSSGDGLVQGINIYGNVYEALRYYNSGNVDASNLCLGGATASYVADVASRLTGWTN
ncbi:hypothetical protein V500_08095 [Pseudogymnoascus sp. VKM F-4518 (FW-2643)]|nr:hypothetical protein V500_08095 [Pseudogymnoascus sp. VKM F-4518 (FW-2643)]